MWRLPGCPSGKIICGKQTSLQTRTIDCEIHEYSKEDGKDVDDDYDSQNMERDAKQFADWGVDYVKVAISRFLSCVVNCVAVFFIFVSFAKVAISLNSPLSISEQQFITTTIFSTDL